MTRSSSPSRITTVSTASQCSSKSRRHAAGGTGSSNSPNAPTQPSKPTSPHLVYETPAPRTDVGGKIARESARRGGSRQRGLGTSVLTPADNQVKASTMYSPPHGYGAKRVLGAVKW